MKHTNWRKSWQWRLRGAKAAVFLKAIYPYLRIKKAEADLAMDFQSKKSMSRGAAKGHWGVPPKSEAELAIEEAQRILMKNLKRVEV